MGSIEIWTAAGWVKRERVFDVCPGDVFRVVTDGATGASLVAFSSARKIKLPNGQDGWHVDSKLLNPERTSFCNECGAVLDAEIHDQDCPCCENKLDMITQTTARHRVFVDAPKKHQPTMAFH